MKVYRNLKSIRFEKENGQYIKNQYLALEDCFIIGLEYCESRLPKYYAFDYYDYAKHLLMFNALYGKPTWTY